MREYGSPTAKTGESAESEPGDTGRSTGEPWRYTCPRRHIPWRSLVGGDNRYYCESCGRHFEALYDRKRGEYVELLPEGSA